MGSQVREASGSWELTLSLPLDSKDSSGNRGREGRQALQVFCSKAGEETGELWLSDRKENEDHLLDSQDYIASRFPGSEYLWVWWQTFLPLLKSFFFQNQTGMGERNF